MSVTWLENSDIFIDRLDSDFYAQRYVDCQHRITRSGKIPLASVCKKIVDHSFLAVRSEDYVESGVPFIRVKDLGDLLLDTTDLAHITTDANLAESNTIFKPGDLLIAKTGKLAVSVVPSFMAECNTSQDVMGAVVDDECDPYYLAAYLGSDTGLLIQERWQSGQVQRHLTLGSLRRLSIFLPEQPVQVIIGNLVRKAERLRYLSSKAWNESQELLCKSLSGFPDTTHAEVQRNKGWYAKSNDLESRLDAEYYLPEHLELIRHLVEKNSKTLTLEEVEVQGAYGVLPSSDEYGNGSISLIRGKDLSGQVLMEVPDSAPLVPNHYLDRGNARLRPLEVMLLIKGATIADPKSVGIVSEKWTEPAIINGSIYKFVVRSDVDPFYICAFMGSRYGLMQKLRAIANTGIFYNDQDAIRAFKIAIPDEMIQKAIGERVKIGSEMKHEYRALISTAKKAVELVIDGCPLPKQLLEKAADVANWLVKNKESSPSEIA